jgi:predicted MFS family arabinose efflux permease
MFPLFGLLALATAAFTDVVTDLLPAGLLPQMSGSLHVSGARIGLLVSAFAIASAVAAIPVTAVLRGLPRRAVLIGALTGFALCDAATAVSPSYLLTFVIRLVAGVMGGTLWSMLAGYAARIVPAERRGRAIAIVLGGITVALCLGIPAGTALASAVGWRVSFGLLAGLALVVALAVRWKLPWLPGSAGGSRAAVREVVFLPGIRSVLAITVLLLTGHQVMYTYIAPYLEWSGFGRVGLVLLVFGVATIAGVWMAGALADRHLRPTLVLGLAAVMIAMGGLASRTPVVLLGGVVLWGAAYGAAPTLLQTALIGASGPASADVATALQTTVYNVGIAAGSLCGGIILDRAGARFLPWGAGSLVAAALTIVLAYTRPSAKQAARCRT